MDDMSFETSDYLLLNNDRIFAIKYKAISFFRNTHVIPYSIMLPANDAIRVIIRPFRTAWMDRQYTIMSIDPRIVEIQTRELTCRFVCRETKNI